MAGFVWGDAVSGVPTYTGKALRLLMSALGLKSTARPLGGTSGVTAGTPSSVLSVTSSQWTVQPISGFLDVSAASDGGTPFAFDTAVTGGVNAADSSNPRIDLLFIRHDDPAESAGPAAPAPVIGYLAGTAGASPTLPATPARSMPLAQISVPKLNNGAPTITLIAPFTVAAGGNLPVRNSSEYPTNPYVGQHIYDLSQKATLTWNGSTWAGGDTGWIDAPYANGFQNAGTSDQQLQVRIKNGVWFVKGTVKLTSGNFAGGNTAYTVTGVLPVPRPASAATTFGKPLAGGGGAAGTHGYIDSSNRLAFLSGSAANSYVTFDGLSGYPVD